MRPWIRKRNVFHEITPPDGVLAEYVVAPIPNVLPLPEGLDPVIGSVLGIARLTAYRMLVLQKKSGAAARSDNAGAKGSSRRRNYGPDPARRTAVTCVYSSASRTEEKRRCRLGATGREGFRAW